MPGTSGSSDGVGRPSRALRPLAGDGSIGTGLLMVVVVMDVSTLLTMLLTMGGTIIPGPTSPAAGGGTTIPRIVNYLTLLTLFRP